MASYGFATTQLSTLTHAKQQQQDQRVALINSSNHVLCSNARLATMTPSNNKSTTEQCRNQQGAEPPVDDSMDISESTNSNNEEAVLSNNVEKLPFLWQILSKSDNRETPSATDILQELLDLFRSRLAEPCPRNTTTDMPQG